jgi:hypothetical protein
MRTAMPLTVPNACRVALATAMMTIMFVESTIALPAGAPDISSQVGDTRAPDRVAFDAAEALKDPAAKLKAMYAFGDQFSDSHMVTDSEQIIFELLVEHWPERRGETSDAIDRLVSRIPTSYPVNREHQRLNDSSFAFPLFD